MLDVLPGGPLLLMELAFLLRSVGAEVCWITIQKPLDSDEVIYSLEHKMLDRGVQVIKLDASSGCLCMNMLSSTCYVAV